jgi:hypothetical protein
MSVTLISTARDILPPVIAAFHAEQIPANQELSLMTGYTLHKDKHGNYIPSQTPLEFSRYVMEQALGIPIDGIQNFNFDAAAQILHALIPTGVDITLTTEVRDTDPTTFYYNVAPGTLHFPAGLNHLGAWDLINLMRARHGSSDLDRQDRQRQILMAVIKSVRNNLSATRLDQKLTFLAALDQNVSSSLTQFEQNAADASKPEFVPSPSTAYSQEYGISLHRLFDFLNKNLPTLAAAYTTKQLKYAQELIEGAQAGSGCVLEKEAKKVADKCRGASSKDERSDLPWTNDCEATPEDDEREDVDQDGHPAPRLADAHVGGFWVPVPPEGLPIEGLEPVLTDDFGDVDLAWASGHFHSVDHVVWAIGIVWIDVLVLARLVHHAFLAVWCDDEIAGTEFHPAIAVVDAWL